MSGYYAVKSSEFGITIQLGVLVYMHGLDDNIKMTYNGKKRRNSMKRYIAFVLSALMCANL